MMEFTVIDVIDGDTFKVEPRWKLNDHIGDTVRPKGYNTPEKEKPGYEEAKQKLARLILRQKVDIAENSATIDAYGRLLADVYYDGKNLADYFPEFKE